MDRPGSAHETAGGTRACHAPTCQQSSSRGRAGPCSVLFCQTELPIRGLVARCFGVGGGRTPCRRDTLRPGGMQALTLAPHVPPWSPPAYSSDSSAWVLLLTLLPATFLEETSRQPFLGSSQALHCFHLQWIFILFSCPTHAMSFGWRPTEGQG